MPDIISQLKALKLHGMADSYAELQSQGASGATASMESSVWLLRHLLEAESTDRAIRSIRYQINAARFPVHRNLAGFDFTQSKVDESLINRLATMEFTDAAQRLCRHFSRNPKWVRPISGVKNWRQHCLRRLACVLRQPLPALRCSAGNGFPMT